MYNANSVPISTIVYYYFMHLRTADKTVAPGAEDDLIYYPPRPQITNIHDKREKKQNFMAKPSQYPEKYTRPMRHIHHSTIVWLHSV